MFCVKKNRAIKLLSFGLITAIALTACGGKQNSESGTQSSVAQSSSVQSIAAPIVLAKKKYMRVVDFETLREENSDVAAWIKLPGTIIDYPIMYSGDNSFYLAHNEKKEKSHNGAVFMDMLNDFEVIDPVIVTYGHFTSQNTYYAQIHSYKDKEYFDNNRELYVYLPRGQRNYEVVAAFLTDDASLLHVRDYSTPEGMQDFVDWIKGISEPGANINMENASAQDEYIVLSTCTQARYRDKYRYLVIARLLEEI